MKKEEWINNILESASEIKEAEPNPYLYSKILNRLNHSGKETAYTLKHNLRWAAVIFDCNSI